jgi:MYXO-CTERM domain-containing protein
MQMVYWSAETDLLLEASSEWTTAEYGDSGHFANQYGPNPDDKGRDFLRCIGDVPNPGYDPNADPEEASAAFMPFAETLFVMPIAGQKPDQPKNAMFLSFIPGKSDEKLTAGKVGDGTDTPIQAPGSGQTPATGEQAGGCSVGSGSESSSERGVWLLFGLALAWITRRRRAASSTPTSGNRQEV